MRKSLASAACAVVSMGAKFIALSSASSAAGAAATGGLVSRNAVRIAESADALAILLALLALVLAVLAWPKEKPWVRVPVLCLSLGAALWSLVMV
jgi:hypothetical protein